jgi:mRNA-degrading endonuclease RelE of RelBE toxin-antitoxin system
MYNVTYSKHFEKSLRKLIRRFKNFFAIILGLVERLTKNPDEGVALGNNYRKIRVGVGDGKGKSGGARVITRRKSKKELELVDVYTKLDKKAVKKWNKPPKGS